MLTQRNMVAALQQHVQSKPDAIAYRFLLDGESEEVCVSYRELDNNARRQARQFLQVAAPGDRAILVYQPGLDFLQAFYACLYSGVVAVPVYPPSGERSWPKFASIIADCTASLVCCDRKNLLFLQKKWDADSTLSPTLLCTDIFHPIDEMPEQHSSDTISGSSTAFIQYTSGTTGDPKGVVVSHENIAENLNIIQTTLQSSEKSHLVSWLPVYHDMGLIATILQAGYVGFPLTFMSPLSFVRNPLRWFQAMHKYRATLTGCPNFGYELCNKRIKDDDLRGLDLSSMRVFSSGAERIRPKTMSTFLHRFSSVGIKETQFNNCYGMAESTLMLSTTALDAAPRQLALNANAFSQGIVAVESTHRPAESLLFSSCGRAELHQLKIVDPESMHICQAGQIGEIWATGKSIAQGYWGKPELTEQIFRATLPGKKGVTYLRTGDLGFIDAGEVFVCGRKKELIILKGKNYYPQDIEQVVSKVHSSIRHDAIAAFSVDDNDEENLVIVLEIRRREFDPSALPLMTSDIRFELARTLSVEVHQVVFVEQSSLPFTSSNKLQRQTIKSQFLTHRLKRLTALAVSEEILPL